MLFVVIDDFSDEKKYAANEQLDTGTPTDYQTSGNTIVHYIISV